MAEAVIAYPGAKWRFYPYMKPYFPKDMRVFCEPFLGGASVSLSVADDPEFSKLEEMYAGDLSKDIYDLWVGIRDNADDVMSIADKWIREKCPLQVEAQGIEILKDSAQWNAIVEEGRKFWDFLSKVDCSTLTTPECSARKFLIHRISFSGMGDSGSLSKEQYMGFKFEHLEKIKKAQPLLRRIKIMNCGFDETMKYAPENDGFIFLDPPYAKQETSGLYGRGGDMHHGFPHKYFADFTKATKTKWFVTYDDSVVVRKLFRGKGIYILPFSIPGGYTMAGKTADDALNGEEVFIANYDIVNTTSYGILEKL